MLKFFSKTKILPNSQRARQRGLDNVEYGSNYPVYDENNLLNSNANFDYGPFIDLASQIKAKSLAGMTGSTNPILFSYTFTTGGTYVFTDYTITTNTMVVVVASTGGTCPSSTANVQTSTSTSVSSTGSTQTTDIVQNMDYYMLSILLVLLIAIICFVGLSVAYWLHNAFNIKVPKSDGYRNYQKTHDLQFEILGDEDAPEVLNHHICKGFLVSDEHDMENVSYNIHAEIIQHSQEFLDLYDSAMNITEETKMNNKRITNELIYELDAMIKLIGDSAITGKMYYGPAKDLEDVMRDMQKDQHLLDKSDQRPITPNEIDSLKSVLKKEILEKEDQLRVLIMKDDTKSKEETIKQEIMKEMNIQSINDSEDQIFNIKNKSFQTKFKEKIEEDDNFSSLEKDKMIFDYERKLENIEVELEKERNRQDHSLSQLLKIRNEERRKKQTLKGIEDKKNKELDKVQKQFEEKLKDEYDNIDKLISEAEIQLTWSNSKTDKDGYKQEINRLRDKKKDIGKQIEQNRLKAAKDAISRLDKEGEMTESSIKSLIDQFIPKEKLDEINQEFKDQKDKLDKEKEYKIEELRRKQEEDIEFEQELGGYGDNVADQIVNLFSQRFLEELHEATNEEKDVHFERMNRLKELLRNIDIQSEKESLLNAWNNMDNSLEEDVRRDQERNNESLSHKIEERRKFNRIKKMEALRIIHEEEEAKLMINLGVCWGCKI